MAKCFKERDPRQAIGQASSACMAGVCVFLKLRCFGFYRTRTRCFIFEYEKPGKTSIETPTNANSATSKCERGELACLVLREIPLGGNHVETMVEYGRMLNTLRHRRSERSGRRIRL